MKKTKKKLLLTAVTAMLACTLTSGLAMTAFADQATKDHEFDARNGDIVFEDFDRANIDNTVSTTTSDKTDLGEAPYLHVEYAARTGDEGNGARNGWIYKQGSGDLATVKDSGAIKITMRAPDGDVEIGDLCFAVRGDRADDEAKVFVKSFSELYDGELGGMPALSTTWVEYEIDFSNSYEPTDKYPGTELPIIGEGSPDMTGFHIFPEVGKDGKLDILSVEYKTTGGYQPLNEFIGGDSIADTAKAANAGTWWADSENGDIVKRMPTLTNGGDLIVKKEAAVGDYAYAVIEAEGDVENLKVATTTDGTNFGTPTAYDGYSVALTGEEKGFKFTYDGETSVKIKRIYLTNLVTVVPDIATPVIDVTTAEYLDDFSVAQSGINGNWDEMSTAPELADANMDYRLSYNNPEGVEIKDGVLVMDGSEELTNFKFKSKAAHARELVVLKLKVEGDNADLSKFRFGLTDSDDKTSDAVWANDFKSGVNYKSRLLTSDNPYRDGDWYYIVVNIAESGFPAADGYSGMNMYYEGGKLIVDEIFFADKVDLPMTSHIAAIEGEWSFTPTVEENWEYAFGLDVPKGSYDKLEFTLTPGADFDATDLRFEVGGTTYWIAQHDDVVITEDGKKYGDIEFEEGTAVKLVFDLNEINATAVFNAMHFHTTGTSTGAFKVTDLVLTKYVNPYKTKIVDTENAVTANDIDFEATDPTYQYAGAIEVARNVYATLELDFTPGDECDGPTGIRLSFDGVGTRWCVANDEGVLITEDGKRVDEYIAAYLEEHQEDYEGGPIHVVIDLEASGITEAFNLVHVHTDGVGTGSFKMSGIKLTPYMDFVGNRYEEALDEIGLYLDTEAPTVTITNATTAVVGDEITVTYTVNDNATPTEDLVVEVTVTKDGDPVTLTDGKFTAEEGVYTITVKVTDIAGNEAIDTKQITVAPAGGSSGTGDGTGTGGNSGSGDAATDNGGKKLSGGAIAGIVIGSVLGAGAIAVGVFFLIKYLRKKKEKK